MNSASIYIKKALVNALDENNYSAVITIAETLQSLTVNSNNTAYKPTTTSSLTINTHSILKSGNAVPVPVTGKAGKFKNRNDVHGLSQYREFTLTYLLPQFKIHDIFTSREFEEYFFCTAMDQKWFYQLDFEDVRSGGKPDKPKFLPRWQVQMRNLTGNMQKQGILTRIPNPNGKNRNIDPATYQLTLIPSTYQ